MIYNGCIVWDSKLLLQMSMIDFYTTFQYFFIEERVQAIRPKSFEGLEEKMASLFHYPQGVCSGFGS